MVDLTFSSHYKGKWIMMIFKHSVITMQRSSAQVPGFHPWQSWRWSRRLNEVGPLHQSCQTWSIPTLWKEPGKYKGLYNIHQATIIAIKHTCTIYRKKNKTINHDRSYNQTTKVVLTDIIVISRTKKWFVGSLRTEKSLICAIANKIICTYLRTDGYFSNTQPNQRSNNCLLGHHSVGNETLQHPNTQRGTCNETLTETQSGKIQTWNWLLPSHKKKK